MSQQRRVAVAGSGVAGLTAAYVLSKSCHVTLYEADERIGGHADTHDVLDRSGIVQHVDTGFIVHNRKTYPTLLRLFAELDVPTQESDMSMSVQCRGCGLEYAGARGIRGLFAQPRSLRRPRYLKMLGEILRFHRQAKALLAEVSAGGQPEITLGAFLDAGGYSTYFRQHFMTPVVAAVWSTAPSQAERYPARYLFSFLDHHGMLAVTGSPRWRTVTGGSRSYVERLAKHLGEVRTGTPVRTIARVEEGVRITDAHEQSETYAGVVIATHPHQALTALAQPTPAEREVLGAINYTPNETVLHHDETMLPTAAGARASWNYQTDTCRADSDTVVLSYDMNRLQRLGSAEPWVVTLNATSRLDPASIVLKLAYEHPLYTPESVAAQARLPELADGVVAYAGAYHGWGFHEDGALSGLRAAQSLGARW